MPNRKELKPCKEHVRIYIGNEFDWCKCCGALHRVTNVNEEKCTDTEVGEWVLPNKDLTCDDFLKLTEQHDEVPSFKIIEGGLLH